jgi:hypothetical protein
MDVAPAAAEVAVVTRAVVQGVCVQQYAAAAAWLQQRAVCIGGAAGGGGRVHNCNGWQAASVRAAAGSGCGMHATACSRAACVRQHAAAASGWEQSAARLQLKTVMAAGGGGGAKSSGCQLLLANVWNFHTGIVHKVILGSLPKIFYIFSKCIVHTIEQKTDMT